MNQFINEIKDFISRAWAYIKKIWTKVINFAKNILSFFRNPEQLKKIQENKELIAVAIKENLENGNYTVINCLFDKEKGVIEDHDSVQIVQGEKMDPELEKKFANKEMIVLN